MKIGAVVLFLAALLVTDQISLVSASPATTPAFLWSPHLRLSDDELKEAVNYQIISPKDLVTNALSQGGWSNFLCPGKEIQQPVDLALVFIGRELQSSDLSESRKTNPDLVDLLKASYTRSNFSIAFPYVATSEEERIENLLVSGLTNACGHALGVSNIMLSESCSVKDGNMQKLAGLQSLHDRLVARKEKRTEGQADVVIFCSGSSLSPNELYEQRSESEILFEVISSVEQSGAKYTALYVSDPYTYPSYRELQRFLSESAAGNGSGNATTTCDEVCQIKSSLFEGVLVGIVLLLILISGLCCMAGIDTPTRFETPQDS